jgi:hypothetical protein
MHPEFLTHYLRQLPYVGIEEVRKSLVGRIVPIIRLHFFTSLLLYFLPNFEYGV